MTKDMPLCVSFLFVGGASLEKLFEIIGSAVSPTSFIGGILILLFWLRRQETGIRTEITGSLERLQKEREGLEESLDEAQEKIKDLNDTVDKQLNDKRTVELKLHEMTLRAETAESILEKMIEKGKYND